MDVLDAYDAVRKAQPQRLRLPEMRRGGYGITDLRRFDDPDALWAALAESAPTQGWLLFQSLQLACHHGLPSPRGDWGVLFAAEAVTAEGESLAVSQDGAGGWVLVRLRHDPGGNGLCDTLRQYVHDPITGRLTYRRYWRFDPGQGYVQERACFVGFE